MNISGTDSKSVLMQLNPQLSGDLVRTQIANAVAVKQAKINKEVAVAAIELLDTASQISGGQAPGRGIDVKA